MSDLLQPAPSTYSNSVALSLLHHIYYADDEASLGDKLQL